MDFPTIIDPKRTFDGIAEWIREDLIGNHSAPGVIIGLSGTDSLVAFLAAYEAFSSVGKADRVWGVHFVPSDDFLYDHPEASAHLWFSAEVVPWLRKRCPDARIEVNTSIDWRMDGVRWGMLGEMGAVDYSNGTRRMRDSADRYWVVGTRNRSEDVLYTYSNASMAAGFQPLINVWKSEILQVSRHLGIPQMAIDKSCDVDCICGRQRLPAHHIREVDLLLMVRQGELSPEYTTATIPEDLRKQLIIYVQNQISRSSYKRNIPFRPSAEDCPAVDPMVSAFELGILDLRTFNHKAHLYVGWYYLQNLLFSEAWARYCTYLKRILHKAGVGSKFSADITERYLKKLNACCEPTFEETLAKHPELMERHGTT